MRKATNLFCLCIYSPFMKVKAGTHRLLSYLNEVMLEMV